MSEFVIFDIDGTISEVSHRVHHAQAGQWDEFHSLAGEDRIIVKVADLLRLLAKTHKIILLTGRSENYRGATEKWLREAALDFSYTKLLMRPEFNRQKDIDMKIFLLEDFFGCKENVLDKVWFVVDDREKVVEGFRNYGLTVLQPAPSSY